MTHITTQTFEAQARADDIEIVGMVLDLLSKNQLNEAKRLLVIYHDSLLMASHPKVVPYDQRVHS